MSAKDWALAEDLEFEAAILDRLQQELLVRAFDLKMAADRVRREAMDRDQARRMLRDAREYLGASVREAA